jgi:C2HE / C2H2 / C2HC zinc-binding finger
MVRRRTYVLLKYSELNYLLEQFYPAHFLMLAIQVKTLKPTKYEPILKEPLACFRCNAEMKNIPLLKKHLEEEWDKLERRGREGAARKRKAEVKDEPTSSANTS